MIKRIPLISLAIALALFASACGGDSESDAGSSDADSSSATSSTAPLTDTTEVPSESVPEPSSDPEPAGDDGGCKTLMTPAEIESVLGVAPEITGASKFCNLVFADDAVGALAVFSGDEADEAIDTLLTKFSDDPQASAEGVLLADGNGYVHDTVAVVRGESGRVFRFDSPSDFGPADIQVAMESIAELLLVR